MLKKYYLGRFFWAPIPVKRYQNLSGFAGVNTYFGNAYVRYFIFASYAKICHAIMHVIQMKQLCFL